MVPILINFILILFKKEYSLEFFINFKNSSRIFEPIGYPSKFNDSYLKCIYYNEIQCQITGNKGCGLELEICVPETGQYSNNTHCIGIWQKLATTQKRIYQGCWFGNEEFCSKDKIEQCNSKYPTKQNTIICCCNGMLCNENFTELNSNLTAIGGEFFFQ